MTQIIPGLTCCQFIVIAGQIGSLPGGTAIIGAVDALDTKTGGTGMA